jgi:predicted Fe-S protein YdhL (DUF1289 family)
MSAMHAPIVTPCVKVCTIDPERRLCRGCLRSVDEIAAWWDYSDAERRAIMARLPERGADPVL